MILLKRFNINLHINLKIKNIILITLFLTSISVNTLFVVPVKACHYVGTYESDFETPKTTFMLGETVYGKGGDDVEGDFRLRIRDPSDNVMYISDPVFGKEVTCSWSIYEDATPGVWDIQLGEYYDNDWHWFTDYERISHFDVLTLPEYTLTIYISSQGTVTKDPDQTTYTDGTLVQLTANPNKGWAFDYWSGDLNSYNNPETLIMDNNKIVTAHFSEDQYLLTINVDGDGIISKDPDHKTYIYGTLVGLTAIAYPGWTFNCWSGDLNSNNNSETINMTSDKNIYAHFKKQSTNGNGGDSGHGGTSTGAKVTTENLPPVADSSADAPYQGLENSEITFNGSLSYDLDGYIISWKWDFGDGSNGEGEITSHNYSTAGMYNVLLTVTDDKGASNESEILVLINPLNMPPSNPEINGPIRGREGIEYTYAVVSTDDDNDSIKYVIDWGDGDIAESEFLPNGTIFKITHSWKSVGSFTIKATANDNQIISSSELTIIIDEPAPEEENFVLLFLALLALILLILFFILGKRKKKKKNK